jgi:uncharacterized protein YbjT (DUF2867 family)
VKPHVLLFGATKGVGLELARILVQDGVTVTAMVRPASDVSSLAPLGVHILNGDAFEADEVRSSIERTAPQVVVSTLGGKSADGRRVDDVGNSAVIRACVEHDVSRVILVTSLGCGEMFPWMSERAKEAFGAALLAKTHAEEVLRETGLDWTIIRPGGLRDGEAGGHGALYEVSNLHGYIYRKDVARLIAQLLTEPRSYKRVLVALDAQELTTDSQDSRTPWAHL